jgi:putative protease
MFKPELLLPAGTLEAFFAAMEGGADAVYLGLKKFNARGRAKNFSYNDLLNVVAEAHSRGRKVYVTLNTLLKNNEIPDLIETLSALDQCCPDALIVQDLAVANIVGRYFPNLQLHASTQMSVHNSLSCNYLRYCGFSRVVLARELTMHELSQLMKSVDVETEIFIHGALCYSVSGQCLFSSYLGGNSANRGLCTQVCRRSFKTEKGNLPLFSMKDFQLVDLIPDFARLKVSSLKVEGRMKTPDYVYNVARAYRMAIDDHSRIAEAKDLLMSDFAREKTLWFMGHDVANSVSSRSETGIYVGKIESIDGECIVLRSEVELTKNAKLRCRNSNDTSAEFIRIEGLSRENDTYRIFCNTEGYTCGQDVYLVGFSNLPFQTKFRRPVSRRINFPSQQKKDAIRRSFPAVGSHGGEMRLFLRVSNSKLLRKLNPNGFEAIFAKLSLAEVSDLITIAIPKETKQRVFVELPKYISELSLAEWKSVIAKLYQSGYKRFVVSNISQLPLLPSDSVVAANENVYLMNDIAVNFARSEKIRHYCYPVENDYPNLISGRDRGGIIPIYFHPDLFYSRQPIVAKAFSDESKSRYGCSVEAGFTVVSDCKAVSWTQNVEKFRGKGFCRFLIDISFDNDLVRLSEIMLAVKNSTKMPNTVDFNMKKGLK